MGEAFASALTSAPPPSDLALEVATEWRAEQLSGRERAISDRLPALRALLLRRAEPIEPGRIAPIAFALACLPALQALSPESRHGVSDVALDRELTVFAAALLPAGTPGT